MGIKKNLKMPRGTTAADPLLGVSGLVLSLAIFLASQHGDGHVEPLSAGLLSSEVCFNADGGTASSGNCEACNQGCPADGRCPDAKSLNQSTCEGLCYYKSITRLGYENLPRFNIYRTSTSRSVSAADSKFGGVSDWAQWSRSLRDNEKGFVPCHEDYWAGILWIMAPGFLLLCISLLWMVLFCLCRCPCFICGCCHADWCTSLICCKARRIILDGDDENDEENYRFAYPGGCGGNTPTVPLKCFGCGGINSMCCCECLPCGRSNLFEHQAFRRLKEGYGPDKRLKVMVYLIFCFLIVFAASSLGQHGTAAMHLGIHQVMPGGIKAIDLQLVSLVDVTAALVIMGNNADAAPGASSQQGPAMATAGGDAMQASRAAKGSLCGYQADLEHADTAWYLNNGPRAEQWTFYAALLFIAVGFSGAYKCRCNFRIIPLHCCSLHAASASLVLAIFAWFVFCISLPLSVFVSDFCVVLKDSKPDNNLMTAFLPCGENAANIKAMVDGANGQLDQGFASLCAAYFDLCAYDTLSDEQPDCCVTSGATCKYKDVCPKTKTPWSTQGTCCHDAAAGQTEDTPLPASDHSTCCPVKMSQVKGGCPTNTAAYTLASQLCGGFQSDAEIQALKMNNNFTNWVASDSATYLSKDGPTARAFRFGCPKDAYVNRKQYQTGLLSEADVTSCEVWQVVAADASSATRAQPGYVRVAADGTKTAVSDSDFAGCSGYQLCDEATGSASCTNPYPAGTLTSMVPCAVTTYSSSGPGPTISKLVDNHRSSCSVSEVENGLCTPAKAGSVENFKYSLFGTQAYLMQYATNTLNASTSFFAGYNSPSTDEQDATPIDCATQYLYSDNQEMCNAGKRLKGMIDCSFVPGSIREVWIPVCSEFKYGLHLVTVSFLVLGIIMMLSACCLIRGFKHFNYQYQRAFIEERKEVIDDDFDM